MIRCVWPGVQVVIPRRVLVCKTGKEVIPFKYLCWLCYRVKLPRDLYLVDDDEACEPGDCHKEDSGLVLSSEAPLCVHETGKAAEYNE